MGLSGLLRPELYFGGFLAMFIAELERLSKLPKAVLVDCFNCGVLLFFYSTSLNTGALAPRLRGSGLYEPSIDANSTLCFLGLNLTEPFSSLPRARIYSCDSFAIASKSSKMLDFLGNAFFLPTLAFFPFLKL